MSRTLFVTGASTGIGAAAARAAAAAGWNVALFARSADTLSALAEEIGSNALPCAGDAASPEDQSRAVAAAVDRFGGLDAAFANAGLGAAAPGTEGGDLDNWRAMLDVNIWGALLTAKAALPHLRASKGHFLVTGSNAGRRHMKGSVYGATKWFIRGWAGNLAMEMEEWGGRCTILSPGMVDTPFFDSPKPQGLTAEDVARSALFALDQPAGVNLREIHVTPMPAS
ncbi:MAG: SDR family NAD(P)-dependent oxidoreductase [Pseudomonadota bacterium]